MGKEGGNPTNRINCFLCWVGYTPRSRASLKALKPNLSQLYCCKAEGRGWTNKTSDSSKAQFPPPFLKFGFVFIEIYSQASTCFPAGMRGQAATGKKKKRSLFHTSISLFHVGHNWTMNLYGKRRHILCQCKCPLLRLTINVIQTGPFRTRSKLVFVLFCSSVVNSRTGNHQLFALEAGFRKADLHLPCCFLTLIPTTQLGSKKEPPWKHVFSIFSNEFQRQ